MITTITTTSRHDRVSFRRGCLFREVLAELAHDVFETPQRLVSLLAVSCLVLINEVLVIVIYYETSSKVALREHQVSIRVSLPSTSIVTQYFLVLDPQILCRLQENFRAFQVFKTCKFGHKEPTVG